MSQIIVNRATIGLALCGLLVVGPVWADSTQVLNLQHALVKQSGQLSHLAVRYGRLKGADRSAVKAYKRSQKLPAGTDRNYEVARYVRSEARVLESLVNTVIGIRHLNAHMRETVSRLAKAFSSGGGRGREGLKGLKGKAYRRALDNLSGLQGLMEAVSADPALSKRMDFGNVRAAYRNAMSEALDGHEGGSHGSAVYYKRLAQVFDSQDVLLHQALDRLHDRELRLDQIQVGNSSMTAISKVRAALSQMDGLMGGKAGQAARQRDESLLKELRPEDVSSGEDGSSESSIRNIGARLKALREKARHSTGGADMVTDREGD